MIDRIREAARRTTDALRRIGEGAFYLWPDDVRRYSGYSYTIPKEEQIRSELYRHLDGQEGGPSFELEWNVYVKRKSHSRVVRLGEIDLVGFFGGKIVATLEIKRIWNLDRWNYKIPELLQGVKGDLDKLEHATKTLAALQPSRPLSGVVVASFADSVERMKDLSTGLDQRFSSRVINLDCGGTEHVCEETDQPGSPRRIYLRLDLVQSRNSSRQ